MTVLAWGAILLASAIEIGLAVALKEARGFTRLLPSLLAIGSAFVSLGLLSFAMRVLPVGTAYAVWVGLGAGAVAITGIVFFGEDRSLLRLGSLAFILIGVAGLKLQNG